MDDPVFIATKVAELLSQPSAINQPHLFQWIDDCLRDRGYMLSCVQKGIFGTHIEVIDVC